MELSNRESKYLTEIQKAVIYGAYLGREEKSLQHVANLFPELKIDKSTVFRIAKKYEEQGNFQTVQKSGRPLKVTEEEEKILRETLRKPNGSLLEAQEEIEKTTEQRIGITTLSTHAHKMGYSFQPIYEAKKEQFTVEEKNRRVEYCENLKTYAEKGLTEYFVFADESAFPLQRETNNKVWMSKTTPKIKVKRENNRYVQIWGAISLKGKSELRFLKGKEKWNSLTMAQTLQQKLIPFQEEYFRDGLFFFIQDNARAHQFGPSMQFLQENYAPNIISMPAKSPDLNPIEKIWGGLKNKVYDISAREFENRRLLKVAIINAWEEITLDDIRVHIADLFNNRLDKIIATRGELIG